MKEEIKENLRIENFKFFFYFFNHLYILNNPSIFLIILHIILLNQ